MPFIAIISEPSLVENNPQIILLKELLGANSYESLVLVFGTFTFTSLILSNFFATFNFWISLRFFSHKEHVLTRDLLDIFLSKKSSRFYKTKKSQILKYILSDVDRVIIGTQLALIALISNILISVVVFSLLLYLDVRITLIATALLGFAYILIYVVLAKKINAYGEEFALIESKIYAATNHAIDLFREIKVSGKKQYFIKQYSTSSKDMVDHSIKYHILTSLPTQFVELLAFGALILIATYYSVTDVENSVNTIASISIFAFATYRLVPILNSIFDGFEEILYNSVLLQELLHVYNNKEADPVQTGSIESSDSRLEIHESFELSNISYRYEPDFPRVLNDFSIEFAKDQLTCISGRSGSGKSTILDILLGLIRPAEGCLSVDGLPLKDDDIRCWQNNIGYVPQKVHFLDGTVTQNIAFGVASENIDPARVKHVAEIAAIDELIENQLPDKYDSLLGDGGITLSGGEKQRIGIARSLYHDPQVLVFDEATNELDNETEMQVLNNIKALNNKTIVFVTHKPAVMKASDRHIEIVKFIDSKQ
jgi:ATP-binding cassette subfamily C protein